MRSGRNDRRKGKRNRIVVEMIEGKILNKRTNNRIVIYQKDSG